jgi:hypothetical protein
MKRRFAVLAGATLLLAGCARSASDQARRVFSIPAGVPVDTVVLRDAVRRALPPGTAWDDVVGFILSERIGSGASADEHGMILLLTDPPYSRTHRTYVIGLRFDPQRRVAVVSVSDWVAGD